MIEQNGKKATKKDDITAFSKNPDSYAESAYQNNNPQAAQGSVNQTSEIERETPDNAKISSEEDKNKEASKQEIRSQYAVLVGKLNEAIVAKNLNDIHKCIADLNTLAVQAGSLGITLNLSGAQEKAATTISNITAAAQGNNNPGQAPPADKNADYDINKLSQQQCNKIYNDYNKLAQSSISKLKIQSDNLASAAEKMKKGIPLTKEEREGCLSSPEEIAKAAAAWKEGERAAKLAEENLEKEKIRNAQLAAEIEEKKKQNPNHPELPALMQQKGESDKNMEGMHNTINTRKEQIKARDELALRAHHVRENAKTPEDKKLSTDADTQFAATFGISPKEVIKRKMQEQNAQMQQEASAQTSPSASPSGQKQTQPQASINDQTNSRSSAETALAQNQLQQPSLQTGAGISTDAKKPVLSAKAISIINATQARALPSRETASETKIPMPGPNNKSTAREINIEF